MKRRLGGHRKGNYAANVKINMPILAAESTLASDCCGVSYGNKDAAMTQENA
jgi:hypothetical protein